MLNSTCMKPFSIYKTTQYAKVFVTGKLYQTTPIYAGNVKGAYSIEELLHSDRLRPYLQTLD